MKMDAEKMSNMLATSTIISDYDFWRAAKTINQALYMMERRHLPIPIEILQARNVIRKARQKRK